ncbi:MAG: hypothetical protein M3Y48_25100 [Actinomycetota bacterium]|nr:hypothetical protein [Actinomycetota bacterium]
MRAARWIAGGALGTAVASALVAGRSYHNRIGKMRGSTAELPDDLPTLLPPDRRSWLYQRHELAHSTAPRVRQLLYDVRSHGRSVDPALVIGSDSDQLIQFQHSMRLPRYCPTRNSCRCRDLAT